jgi:hypothetical protein
LAWLGSDSRARRETEFGGHSGAAVDDADGGRNWRPAAKGRSDEGQTMKGISRRLYLCGGLQGSGSTLVSWCFLQRSDMDGVLDADNDLLPFLDPRLGTPHAWYKSNVGSFRMSELVRHYGDLGWDVYPLLVVRDLRDLWASLVGGSYAANGITAEDPPLRMRLRRFAEDCSDFAHAGWTIIKYESLIATPEPILRTACQQLDLPWDKAMLRWPKMPAQIADCRRKDQSFWNVPHDSLISTVGHYQQQTTPKPIPAVDLQWLEHEFRDFNELNGYPVRREDPATGEFRDKRLAPSFEVTRRYRWEARRKPIRWLLATLGFGQPRSVKRRPGRSAA